MRILRYLLIFILSTQWALGQKGKILKPDVPAPNSAPIQLEQLFSGMRYRSIGPYRGGRSTAVTGIPSKPYTFFMGSTGGGVWRTDDGGTTWGNISDGYLPVGSIGSIRVSLSDPNIMYVGTGSADPRGNVSIGKGIFKSTDGGKSWSFAGLEKGGQIGSMAIHPQNPDVVFVAALGNIFGNNPERGIFRTRDGGKNWEKVCYINDHTGAIEVVIDPNNSRIVYAGMWQVQRKPWTLIDGGPDGGIWQSKDGGDTWKKLEGGLPTGVLGKIGIAVSPKNSDRIWVLVETPDNEKGGLYRSDDGGKSFTRINGSRELRMRAWYYTHIFADPKDEETVYVNNVAFLKSTDGGKSFDRIRVLHGDCHDLWINPENTSIMIHANDGGAHVTYNGGFSWSTLFNQPTAELYRVSVDNDFPYRVYGCQQDNTSISVPSAYRKVSSTLQNWELHEGGESGFLVVDPRNSDLTYAGNYTGIIERYDQGKGHSKNVTHYPQMHDGLPLYDVKYRFQWNAPIRISPHDPNVIYHASQFVHRSKDGGETWKVISPDLTTNNKKYQEIPGGPVQHDYTGVENFTTIFALEESILEPGLLWVGSDDGLIHLSRDGGDHWKNVTPKGLPPLATVNSIDISRHQKGKAFAAVHHYRLNDFKPYIFKTEDYGETWTLETKGIPSDFFVRVVREDPDQEGLLFCGTEFGMFVSLNDGAEWNSFQLNLPISPITDLVFKNRDLVVATQGRSFWILDDLSPLQQGLHPEGQEVQLFNPRKGIRSQLSSGSHPGEPESRPKGAMIYFFMKESPDSTLHYRLEIINSKGVIKKAFSTKPKAELGEEKLKVEKGLNRFIWDMTFNGPKVTPGSFFSMAYTGGPSAPPGKYTVRISWKGKSVTAPFLIEKDPRWDWPDSDLEEQYDLTAKVLITFNEVHDAVRQIRSIRSQSFSLMERAEKVGKGSSFKALAKTMNEKLSILEEALIQIRHQSYQDPINYPPKFDDQIAWLYSIVNAQDGKPTQGCYDLYQDLNVQWEKYRKELDAIIQTDLKKFNALVTDENAGGVIVFSN